jgi:hypothetical protein
MEKKEIPQEVKDVIIDETEKLLFPKPATTVGGKILRFLFTLGGIFVSKKKIKL